MVVDRQILLGHDSERFLDVTLLGQACLLPAQFLLAGCWRRYCVFSAVASALPFFATEVSIAGLPPTPHASNQRKHLSHVTEGALAKRSSKAGPTMGEWNITAVDATCVWREM